MSLPTARKRERPILDLVSVSLIVLALTIFIYASTYLESEAYRASVVAVVLMVSGLVLAILLCGVKIDLKLSIRELSATLDWTIIAVGAILIVNRVAPFTLNVSPIPSNVFAVLMAVSEEVFIRVFLCTWFTMMVGKWLGIFASSMVWMVFHFFTYGSSLRALMIVFGAGCLLGYTYIQSRRASTVILPHALINLISFM